MRVALAVLLSLFALAAAAPATGGAAGGPARCAAAIPDPGDEDCDGVRTDGAGPMDNCPRVANASQVNTDAGYTDASPAAADGAPPPYPAGDGDGDACDTDDDADGVPDRRDADGDGVPETPLDNCRTVRNPTQYDDDDPDTRGDAPDGTALCPPIDRDSDGVADEDDNCPLSANADQADLDGDLAGDVCDDDDDGDGVSDDRDNCPATRNAEQGDRDGDGIGTACDPREFAEAAEPEAGAPRDRTAPVLRVRAARRVSRARLRGGMPLRVACSEACTLEATLVLRGRAAATAEAFLGAPGRTWLLFSPRPRARALLRRGGRAVVRIRAADAAGNRVRRSLRVRVAR